ncbi:unnamed protein product [Leptidea sinapis]|uniref:Nucleoporin NUP42 n=1 Tax=Leptidea sinapis TaxID=189913 RepID=A0A5E4QEA3_9NEOP|nr:unnamed protein product [Leptidea sinapis]
MVACRFFQQGNCRFGQNCRYEHSYSSKYTYHVVACRFFQQGNCRFGQNCNYEHSNNPKYTYHAPAKNTVNDEQLINIVQSDVEAALNGGQWILSCYAPLKDKSCFPGIQDISQEEARLIT